VNQSERSQVDLNALSYFLDSLGSYHEYLVQTIAPDQLIYHYTNLDALNGIVSYHDLWLTNSQYSNDKDESRHGNEIARGVVRIYLQNAKSEDTPDALKIAYADVLSSLIEVPPVGGFYICCFCEEDNLLSQWRSYGANGIGVSIGFAPMEFVYITGQDMPLGLMRLWKVFYDTEQQKGIVNRAIEFVWETRASGQDKHQLARRAADAIQFFVPTFKNADFREEKERRLIFTPDPACPVKPRYRVGRGMLIPYYSVRSLVEAAGYATLKQLPICSIMVGPSAQQDLNKESTNMLLRQNGYDNVDLKASATPYRG
jgi:hypothetical protein